MSRAFALIAAALAVALASLAAPDSAVAGPRNYARPTVQHYYLPTVSNGRVTGLQEHLTVHKNVYCRDVPVSTGDGRSLGSRRVCT